MCRWYLCALPYQKKCSMDYWKARLCIQADTITKHTNLASFFIAAKSISSSEYSELFREQSDNSHNATRFEIHRCDKRALSFSNAPCVRAATNSSRPVYYGYFRIRPHWDHRVHSRRAPQIHTLAMNTLVLMSARYNVISSYSSPSRKTRAPVD